MAAISWVNSGSGDWSVGANWSGGVEPGAADTVLLAGTNAYTVTQDVADTITGLTLSDANAGLVLDQVLSVSQALTLTAGALQIQGGGGLSGGTLAIGAGASATLNGGSLSNVAVLGTLVVTDAGGVLTGGIDFSGASGTGTGTLDYDYGNYYADNYFYAQGNTTLNGATMNIGNTGIGGSVNIFYAQDTTGTGATLTLGPSFILNEVAGNSALQGSDGSKDAIVNDGTIDATTGGGQLQIDATRFINNGVIDTANGGVVFFTGSMTASLIDGVTVGTGGYVGIDGTVKGGTLVSPNGQVGSYDGSGELDGVALHGIFTVEDGGFSLAGANSFAGAGGTGTATLNFDQGNYYSANYLYALGYETLNNAVLNIGNTGTGGSINILYNQDTAGTGAVLTLGKAFTLNAVTGNSGIGSSDGSKDEVINEGTIDATTGGGTLQIDGTRFTNEGVIDTANGGIVELTAAIRAALIDSITVGKGGYVGIDGTVTTGTIVTPDGQIGSFGGSGVLDAVTVQGTFTVEDGGFTLEGPNHFAGNGGSGTGTLNFDQGSYYSTNDLTALGNEELNNVVLNIGNTGLGASSNVLFSKDASGTGVALVLGPQFTLNAVAGNSGIAGTDAAKDGIINEGTIKAIISGGTLQIDATKFTNDGTITTSNGGIIALTGNISASLIDSVTEGTGGYLGIDGTVTGGTITSPNGRIGSFAGAGVLNDVTVQGVLTIEDGGFTLIGKNSFAGTGGSGAGTLNFDQGNYYSTNMLWAQGNETLNNVVLNIGNTGLGGSTNVLFNQDKTATGATLTLGSGFTLNALAGNSGIGGTDGNHDEIINEGKIEATTNGGALQIDATKFVNDGLIYTADGGRIELTGTIAASLVDSISVGTSGFVGIDGTITGGTLVGGSGGVGAVGSGGSLNGVAVQGTLDLESGSFVISGATSFSGSGGTGLGRIFFDYGSVEQADTLYVQGTETLNNVLVDIGNTGQGSTNILYNDDVGGTGAVLTLGSSFELNLAHGSAAIGGSTGSTDGVVNDGLIDATAQGVLLIDPANFKNAGIMDVANGGTVILSTAFTNLAGGTLTGGRFLVGAGGTLDLSNNADLGTLASNLSLSGTNSVVQWLNTSTNQEVSFDTVFSTIDSGATLALLDGRDLTTTNTVTDEGLLSLGGGTLSAGGLAVHSAASVSGAGAILGSVALATNGALSAVGGTLSVTGAVTGTGELKANADASLTIGGSASAQSAVVEAGGLLSVAGTFSAGGITLAGSGDGLAFGTAGSVAGAISGFGSGDTIDITSQTLSSVVWTQKSSSGGSLSLIGAGGGSIGVLVLSGSYTQANFSVASDLHHIDFVAATASVSVLQDIASPSAAVAAPTPDAAYVALHSPAVADVLHVPATHT